MCHLILYDVGEKDDLSLDEVHETLGGVPEQRQEVSRVRQAWRGGSSILNMEVSRVGQAWRGGPSILNMEVSRVG